MHGTQSPTEPRPARPAQRRPASRLLAWLALVLLLAAAGGIPARAESVPEHCAALGWQTENASAVVLGTVTIETERGTSGGREIELRVTESIRGDLAAGTTAAILVPDLGYGKSWTVGAAYLAFLTAEPREEGRPQRWSLLSGDYGLRPLPESGPETRFPEIVRNVAKTLDAQGKVKDAPALLLLLLRGLEDPEPGIAWSAATDFVRHEELHGLVTDDARARIVQAYRACPIGKATKKALVTACAASRHRDAAAALVDSLLLPGARTIRGAVGLALRRLADPSAEERIAAKLPTATVPQREDLLDALGAFGQKGAVPAARRALGDREPTVRFEAAHALGRIARNVREADPEGRIDGRDELEHVITTGTDPGELRAAVWALAQLDDPEAWATLRRLAADDTREPVRRAAARYLKTPRVSLLAD